MPKRSIEDLSYEDLLDQAKSIIVKQMKSLNVLAGEGPLNSTNATSLINIAKFLNEMTIQENALAEKASEDEVETK